jgi:YidC/Oxa1 family membrane protein insertase
MEKNALIAIVLSVLIIILYQSWASRYYGPPPSPEQQQEEPKEITPSPKPLRKLPKPKEKTTATGPLQTAEDVRDIKVETDRYTAIFTNRGARLKSLLLRQYRVSVEEQSDPIEMISPTRKVPYPLGIQFHRPNPFNDEGLIYEIKGSSMNLTGNGKGTLTFRGQTPWGATLIKRFSFVGSTYPIELEVSVSSGESPSLILTSEGDSKGADGDAVFEGPLALLKNDLKYEDDLISEKKGKELRSSVSWAGFGYTYFLFALLPDGEAELTLSVKKTDPGYFMDVSGQAATGADGNSRYTLFIGPKDSNVLKAVGGGLERSIDLGWFYFVSAPVLQMLRFSNRYTGSYGLDIILLTLLIKLLLAPLTHKSFASMKSMQKLQPQMQRIREKFKDEKEKMNKEIMELYKRNKVNPLGGCLPMLLQMPVFIGLYQALRTPIELRHAQFLWIKDLSRPDWESAMLPFPIMGYDVGIPWLVLFMGASMFVQQWMTPTAGDPNQKRMMYMMPVVFTVMFVNFPSGLTIYWLVNNVLTIAQQYLINRMTK